MGIGLRRMAPKMEMETCTSGACQIGLSACHAVLSIASTVTSFHRRAFFFQHPASAFRDGPELQGKLRRSACKLSKNLIFSR